MNKQLKQIARSVEKQKKKQASEKNVELALSPGKTVQLRVKVMAR